MKATGIDPQSAAARLRLGYVEGQESNRDEAMRAFGESERLYRVVARTEGETEVLLRRGGLYYLMGDLKQARVDLERAAGLASTLNVTHQTVRAQLTLSGVTAAEGRFAESERMAAAAVQQALNAGLNTVAADGLIDLTATLMEADRFRRRSRRESVRSSWPSGGARGGLRRAPGSSSRRCGCSKTSRRTRWRWSRACGVSEDHRERRVEDRPGGSSCRARTRC